MSEATRKFVESAFKMEYGYDAVTIHQVGFNTFMIGASDGNVYIFKN